MTDAYIFDALRSPRGRTKKDGGLMHIHPQGILADCLKALARRNNLDPVEVEDVIIGCVAQTGEQGACIARNAILLADWPVTVPGVSLNRFCGSALQAVSFAAMGVMSGQYDLVVAGGVESMSRVPMGPESGGLTGCNPELERKFPIVPQGISADLIATLEGFDRKAVDGFALASQRKCAQAIRENRFDRSLVPIHNSDGSVALAVDEYPRPDSTPEGLGGIKPAFAKMGAEGLDQMALSVYPQLDHIDHVHTAGNSSGIVDGASVVLLGTLEKGRSLGLTPRARIRSTAAAAAEPVIMLTAPVPACQKALRRAGMTIADIDLFEINEAFAAIPLFVCRKLGIDINKVNVNGGAIALGHPLGATGAILLGTLLDEIERRGLATGLVTLCTGGGMGVAAIIERTG